MPLALSWACSQFPWDNLVKQIGIQIGFDFPRLVITSFHVPSQISFLANIVRLGVVLSFFPKESPFQTAWVPWCSPFRDLVAPHSWCFLWSTFQDSLALRVGKIPDTQFPNPNYPNPDPKYPITISDSDCRNPKLVWVIRVMFPGTQTTQITQNISNICSPIPNMKTLSISMPYKYIIWYELM